MNKKAAKEALEWATELMNLIPKNKKVQAIGAANQLFLFLEKAQRELPD